MYMKGIDWGGDIRKWKLLAGGGGWRDEYCIIAYGRGVYRYV